MVITKHPQSIEARSGIGRRTGTARLVRCLVMAVLGTCAACGCSVESPGPRPPDGFGHFCAEARAIQRANSTPVTGNLKVRLVGQLQQLVDAAPASVRDRLEPLRRYDDSDEGDGHNPGQSDARQVMIRALDDECGLTVAIFVTS